MPTKLGPTIAASGSDRESGKRTSTQRRPSRLRVPAETPQHPPAIGGGGMIRQISIRNFRSIASADIDSDWITTLVGANDAGKSNVLRALNLFFNGQTGFREDFAFARDYNQFAPPRKKKTPEIEIRLRFELPSGYQRKNFPARSSGPRFGGKRVKSGTGKHEPTSAALHFRRIARSQHFWIVCSSHTYQRSRISCSFKTCKGSYTTY